MPEIVPNLWFDTEAEQAAEFYCSVFPSSKITNISHWAEGTPRGGSVLTVDFVLDGHRFTGLNGGPEFHFDEAISFLVPCADQDEVDHYWNALVAGGGQESRCGWCKDRFGVSWQIVPARLGELLTDPDAERAGRVMQAMLQMGKIEVSALERAAAG